MYFGHFGKFKSIFIILEVSLGIFVIFMAFGVFLTVLRFQGYFGNFKDFWNNSGIFEVSVLLRLKTDANVLHP